MNYVLDEIGKMNGLMRMTTVGNSAQCELGLFRALCGPMNKSMGLTQVTNILTPTSNQLASPVFRLGKILCIVLGNHSIPNRDQNK